MDVSSSLSSHVTCDVRIVHNFSFLCCIYSFECHFVLMSKVAWVFRLVLRFSLTFILHRELPFNYPLIRFGLMVFKATLNNFSVISWRSVLLVEETRGSGENHRPVASHWQTLSCNIVHLVLIEIRTHNSRDDRYRLHTCRSPRQVCLSTCICKLFDYLLTIPVNCNALKTLHVWENVMNLTLV